MTPFGLTRSTHDLIPAVRGGASYLDGGGVADTGAGSDADAEAHLKRGWGWEVGNSATLPEC